MLWVDLKGSTIIRLSPRKVTLAVEGNPEIEGGLGIHRIDFECPAKVSFSSRKVTLAVEKEVSEIVGGVVAHGLNFDRSAISSLGPQKVAHSFKNNTETK